MTEGGRYAELPIRTHLGNDGRVNQYRRPAILPAVGSAQTALFHRVSDSDRIDILAARHFQQETAWWLIAASSPAMHPDAVLEDPGSTVVIPVPGTGKELS